MLECQSSNRLIPKTACRQDFGFHPNGDSRGYREKLATLASRRAAPASLQQFARSLPHCCGSERR